ncbi:MAG TPA: efflux RND transporter permease subunit [candidate division Zixibacteria bacterium]|nr:efflux RND transporter permease subunit [candidate division Zixibacteria bacterium]
MGKLIRYFVRYPVWVTVLMFSLLVFGLIGLANMRYSFFPETRPDRITIQLPYPGASPEEVAEGVVLKVEENLEGLDGVERVTSVSSENVGVVTVEVVQDYNMDKVLADIKNAVDGINTFPDDAEEPVIQEEKFRSRSLSVLIYGETDLYQLKYIVEDFRDDLLAIDGLSQVEIEGLPDLEFAIQVSEADLERYGLRFDEIATAVQEANINISGGKFDTRNEEILIRAWGRGYYVSDLLAIPIRGNSDGSVVRLADVAEVVERWEDNPVRRFYNGQNALILNIDQTSSEDILFIADTTYTMVNAFNDANPSVHAIVWDDRTVLLRQRLDMLVRNGLIGLLLVVGSLGFFLNLRLSFWVAMGIPLSFAGMFLVVSAWGITINAISLFGMILVVGILVDDAIVVGENIFAKWEQGVPAVKAAIDGTMEVIAPVGSSVISTVIAFLPFFFLDGMLGKFIWQMALVVIASLLFSLLEAFFILPSHLAHSKALDRSRETSAIRVRIERIISAMTHKVYAPMLRWSLRNPTVTLMIPAAMVLITIGLMGGRIIGFTFFPYVDGDTVPVNLSLVAGSQEAETNAVLSRIEKATWEVARKLKEDRPDSLDVITGIKRNIGANSLGESGSHTGQLTIQLLDGERRDMDSYVISNMISDQVGPVPEAEQITFGRTSFFGKPVSISLLGKDAGQLEIARQLMRKEISDFSALKDVTDTDQRGRRELSISLKPRAHALGLTVHDIVGQVRQAFYGQEIQRIQRGRDEIKVWVRYRDEDRSALGFLDQMRIRTPGGEEYPFNELASYQIARGITQISHLDRKREVRVEANLTDATASLPPILEEIEIDVLPRVMSQVNGVTASFEGQSRDQDKMSGSIARVFPIAFFGMLILVILVFRSYAQAMLIFSLIPIGVLGAIWGHGIQGLDVNMLSVIGIIALSGIVINDSIVLVSQVNRYLRQGMKVEDAVFKGGIDRLRPILLTTLTTALGLAPLILETSRQAKFLIPMAISVAYGLVFGTMVLLLILPAAFVTLNKLRVKWHVSVLGETNVVPENLEPAVKELHEELAE